MELTVRASESSKMMTGGSFITDKEIHEIVELYNQKNNGVNENGNKVEWTDAKNKKLNALLHKQSNPELGDTTLTWLKEKAVESVLGYRKDVSNKYLEKGTEVEDDSIELLNTVLFTDYKKHTGRINTEGFTGECDILEDDHVRDIKSSWSIDTFPFFTEDAEKAVKKSGYDWQVRMYMMLYGVDVAYIDYCLVNTPEDLIGWDSREIHIVDHIEVSKRVTTVKIERDEAIEQKIIERYQLCNEKFKELVNELKNK